MSLVDSLKGILGGNAGYAKLTAEKAHFLTQQGGEVTGVVVKTNDGRTAIVNNCAVRWLYPDGMTQLMHNAPSPLITRLKIMTTEEIRLCMGEMSQAEMRTCKAALHWVAKILENEHLQSR